MEVWVIHDVVPQRVRPSRASGEVSTFRKFEPKTVIVAEALVGALCLKMCDTTGES